MENQKPKESTKERKATATQVEMLNKIYQGENLQKLLEANNIKKIEDLPMVKASEIIKKLMEKKNASTNKPEQ